jgi:hypothetical protein
MRPPPRLHMNHTIILYYYTIIYILISKRACIGSRQASSCLPHESTPPDLETPMLHPFYLQLLAVDVQPSSHQSAAVSVQIF